MTEVQEICNVWYEILVQLKLVFETFDVSGESEMEGGKCLNHNFARMKLRFQDVALLTYVNKLQSSI